MTRIAEPRTARGRGSTLVDRSIRVPSQPVTTVCCIAGCGPAGAVLGYLLARAGVDVLVLEKHGDFLRDFRGDTIHPSTLAVMQELGLASELLKLPHQSASISRCRTRS